jgi:hypothetical protein
MVEGPGAGAEHPCPVCDTALTGQHNYGERIYFECPRCGLFGLTRSAESTLPGLLTDARRKATLSYAIRRTAPQGPETNLFDSAVCKRLVETGSLPTPQEQAENFIRWLGANLPGPGETVVVDFADHGAILGAQSRPGFFFVLDGLIRSGLLQGQHYLGGKSDVTLTFAGWERFEQLRRGTPTGRKAFMAMQYRDPLLDRLVNEHFRVAVDETGFVLRRLDDDAPAGLIDDRLRVEIQSSRFLIVDLTHKNAGAYWEAGYAEGLGKPVIYTCEESKFGEASHFDTNHHLHVLWNEGDISTAMKQLKATIRATIPEARRE